MTIKLKNNLVNYEEKRTAFVNAVKNEETQEIQNKAYVEMVDAMAADIMDQAKKEARQEADQYISASRTDKNITNEEIKFFNDINKEVGYKEETLLPQTVVDEIFEDLTTEHPFLASIGMRTTGLRTKFLKSETSGLAVWGKIFGEIKGQLDATFSEEESIQNKLTAFVVVPKDLENFGPVWVKRFVVTQIEEAFAVALESAFIIGDGKDKPVGLTRKVGKGTNVVDGVYPEKVASGTLTFASSKVTVNELTDVYKYHSVKENGKPLNVAGEVTLLVNPTDAWDVKKQYTSLNANGVYVTALPYNLNIIESLFVPEKKAISYVAKRYDALIGGALNISTFDQTLAFEDLNLYAAKQFAYGKAKDEKAAAVWTLNIKPTDQTPEG
ncbi:phage major capsid protein [Listeria monocytogenes]|uniref:Major capsid protein n=6 Tax=root TaxID=1 RepID=A0A059T678_9CAUD|nr:MULTISPECIES: phage major capsid protein [Listeria]YP_009044806.1 major head protein [Listeria phage LP-101]EAA0165972.1 phage major capsid protein [Listeria monocytogenes serotype 1/2a]EAE6023574.1 phage major capsid protein [Listeria monocytogenes serotype 3a]EAG6256134.1 phage major capsid protein [Listeria monocytogenes CFSAN003807]EAG6279367.1 phage major capsid protein [Listeria monocytogenes CFSAN003809]UZV40864.1 major capsid protein [Listeria phage LP-P111]